MSPETVKWSMKNRSWLNDLCLLTGRIRKISMKVGMHLA